MNAPVRALVAAALVAGIHGGVQVLRQAGVSAEVRPPKRDLRELPSRLGPWVAADDLRDADLLVDDDTDLRTTRVYRNAAGEAVSLYIAVWQEYRLRTPHPPEACYAGAGYQILQQKTVEVQVADQLTIPARVLLLERDGERTSVIYWYQHGSDIHLFDYWRRRAIWISWPGEVRPPIVKVMLQVTASEAEKAEGQLKSIAASLFPWTKEL